MNRLTALLSAVTLLASSAPIAQAQSDSFLKVQDPDELLYVLYAGDCDEVPSIDAKMRQAIEKAFIRGRIRTVAFTHQKAMAVGLALNVELSCVEMRENYYVYSVDLRWMVPNCWAKVGEEFHPMVCEVLSPRYGITGIGGVENVIRAAGELTDDAVADFLKVNFDLKPE